MNWNYKTNESTITLHDHEITEWIFGEDITMIFEDGFDVFADCALNDTGRHKLTGKSAVILKNGKFVSGFISLGFVDIHIALEELLKLDLEVLDFKRLPNGVVLDCDAWDRETHKDAGFCEVEFSCKDVLFCWNEFTDDAWFQK